MSRRPWGTDVGSGPPTGRPSVILVREWEMQMSSSGCCGRLEGDFLAPRGERCFPERREVMEAMAPLYRELRERYGDEIELHVVDPRNLGTLIGLLLKEVRAGRIGAISALRALFGLSVTSVLVNGAVLRRGGWPSFEEVEAALSEGARAGGSRRVGEGARPGEVEGDGDGATLAPEEVVSGVA